MADPEKFEATKHEAAFVRPASEIGTGNDELGIAAELPFNLWR